MTMSLPNIVNSVLATGTEDAGRQSLISSTVLPKREGYCSVTMTGISKAAAPLTCHGCQRIHHARSHIDQYRELKYVRQAHQPPSAVNDCIIAEDEVFLPEHVLRR